MNRSPHVPPEQRADYLKSSVGTGEGSAQTCNEGDKATPAGEAGAQAQKTSTDESVPEPPKKKAPAARKSATGAKSIPRKASKRRK